MKGEEKRGIKREDRRGHPTNYQFHVRVDALNTGGFHCSRAGSILRVPFTFSFSIRFCRCSMTASVRTMIQFPLYVLFALVSFLYFSFTTWFVKGGGRGTYVIP